MKVLIISDLHIDESNDWNYINKITDNMIDRVKKKKSEDEELYMFFLGDVINCGGIGNNSNKFSEADKFIKKLKVAFSNVKMLFVPGNHEIEKNSDLTSFNEFIQRHSYKKDFIFTMDSSVHSLEESNVNFILIDSTLTRNYALNGEIDIVALKANMKKGMNIIFMHYPPCQQKGIDRSIENKDELIATHSNFIFYGHQHGNVEVPDFLDNDTDIHAVGTLIKNETGCSNEFLLLDVADGRINYAYRYVWKITNFVANLLFPVKDNKVSHYITLSKPDKNETKIGRRLKKMSSNKKNDKNSFIYNYDGEDIIEVIKKQNLILLLGDAGIGKSFELANIYWKYEKDDDYFPIWVNLRNTSYEDIGKYLELAKDNTIDRKTPLVLLDGLDEMNGVNVSDLIKRLGSATHGNPEVKIILSARTNYWLSIDNMFVTYKILPLSTDQISEIAKENGVEKVKDFLEYLKKEDYSALAQIPFYLFDMIRMYIETGSLPKRESLLDSIISYRFKDGDKRSPCEYEETLMANEYELRFHLSKLSFLMQSLHITTLRNMKYTQYFSSIMRKYFNKTGLIVSKESDNDMVWEFTHNIFREFFVADYLADTPFDELLKVITYDKDRKLLRPSWVNIISLLLPMRKDDQLLKWLIETSPEIIYKFESDMITAEERNKIFIYLMWDCFNKNLPLYTIYDVEKLAKYFQSESALYFLIEVISNPKNIASSLNSISILRYFDCFYNMEYKIEEAIMPYLNATQPEYLITLSIEVLVQIIKNDLCSLTVKLFNLLKDDQRTEVVGALSMLFNKANVADEYSEYLLNILKKDEKIYRNYSVWREFSTAIKSFQSIDNLLKSIYILCSERSYIIHEIDELFDEVIKITFKMHKSEIKGLLDKFIDIFIYCAKNYDRYKTNVIKQRFHDHSLLSDALCRILKYKIPTNAMMFSIEGIMEENLLDILISSYLADETDSEAYKWYARRHSRELSLFNKLNEAVVQKEGMGIQCDLEEEWDKINREGPQKYFDSLFEKHIFREMLNELIGFLYDDVKCGELFGDSLLRIPQNRVDMRNIQTALYHNGSTKCKVKHFLNEIDWGVFVICEICRMFEIYENIVVSLEQEKYLKTYFYKTLADTNFETLNRNQFFIAKHIILLQKKFGFTISDEKLLEMLSLPWYVFVLSTSSGDSAALDFVMHNISDKIVLRNKIVYNIKNKELDPEVAKTYILYCEKEELEEGVEIAIALLKDTSEEGKWCKNCAVNYLITVKGEGFVDNLVDDNIDNDFLKQLSYKINNKNDRIIAMMVKRNSTSEDQLLFLGELISLNNRYALEKYYDLAKKANTLPDLLPEGSRIEPITMSIQEINDISLVDIVINLFRLCFSEGFKDKENFGLRGSLNNAINKLIQVDKLKLEEKLNNLIEECPDNEKLVSTCYWHLENIKQLIDISSDTPWSIEETLAFLESHKQNTLF